MDVGTAASRDPGFDQQTRHYLARTLRNAARDPIPNRAALSPEWIRAVQDQAAPIWNLKTLNGLPFGLVSASFQGAVRQGRILESIQWALEMVRTDAHLDGPFSGGETNPRKIGKGEVNFWTRAFVICAEDIALANPALMVFAGCLVRNPPVYATQADAERAIIYLTILLARSLKSRVADWACICRIPLPEDQAGGVFDIAARYSMLIENLKAGQHVMAIGYAESFIVESLKDKSAKNKDPLPKAIFNQLTAGVLNRGEPLKYYKNKRQLIWAAMLNVIGQMNYPVVREIVESCYDLAHDDKFRWGVPSRLFGRMAILAICLRDPVEQRGLDLKMGPLTEFPEGREFTAEEIEAMRVQLRDQNLWYGISDICKDKHTGEGKRLGRGLQQFVEIKSWLRHEDPALISLSDYYLDLCFQTRYSQEFGGNTPFDQSGITVGEYRKWLPQLRAQQNLLNQIEDHIAKETITITFCEVCENHVGMQKLGALAPEGFTCAELIQISRNFQGAGITAEYYDLRQGLAGLPDQQEAREAGILILRNVVEHFGTTALFQGDNAKRAMTFTDLIMLEQAALDWDKKAFMKGRVVNKHARYNLCYADRAQEPDYEKGKGRIINFADLPGLKSIREKLGGCFGAKAVNLLAEGNRYYDATKCFIGRHGDAERFIVVGMRLGHSLPLSYQWYQNSTVVGVEMKFILNHGDVYLMSSVATGHDWLKKKILTLRHGVNVDKAKYLG